MNSIASLNIIKMTHLSNELDELDSEYVLNLSDGYKNISCNTTLDKLTEILFKTETRENKYKSILNYMEMEYHSDDFYKLLRSILFCKKKLYIFPRLELDITGYKMPDTVEMVDVSFLMDIYPDLQTRSIWDLDKDKE